MLRQIPVPTGGGGRHQKGGGDLVAREVGDELKRRQRAEALEQRHLLDEVPVHLDGHLHLQRVGQHVEARAVFTRGRALFPTHFALLVNSGALENRCELVFIIFIYCTTKFFINLM